MRRSKQATAETRRQIVRRAATEFRRSGIDTLSIADMMASLGLTQGGFYRHFDSKEALVAESMSTAFDEMLNQFESCSGLPALTTAYLSPSRIDDFEHACPLAALGTDLRRADQQTREVASAGIERMVRIISERLTGGLPAKEARCHAIGVVSALVGSMMLARIATNPKAAARILRNTSQFILNKP